MSSAIASRVAEGFQTEMMEDNRVGSNYEKLWGAASKELRWVIDLPDHFWSSLAAVAQSRPDELQDKTIGAAHVSYHFLWRRVLEPASGYPWKLCRGDPDDNLDEIAEMEHEPTESVCRNFWHLLQEDRPRSQLKGVLVLLGQCSWSSMPAEQQHGSLSLLHRWHPDYGLESLVSRALIHQAVRMLPSESKLDKQVSNVIKKVEKVDRMNPEKATGSHLLVSAMVKVIRGRKEHFKGARTQQRQIVVSKFKVCKVVMSGCRLWAAMICASASSDGIGDMYAPYHLSVFIFLQM